MRTRPAAAAAITAALAAIALPHARAAAQDAPPAAHHAAPQAEHAPLVPARWSGAIDLPGTRLDFSVSFTDETTGTIDIPLQGAHNIPLDDIALSADALRFTLKPPGAPENAWARFDFTIQPGTRDAEGTLRQMGMTFPAHMRRLADDEPTPGLRRPQEPTPPFPYEAREVTYTNDDAGLSFAGTLTVPEGPGPHPAVVLVTGSGAQDRDETLLGHKPFLVLADHLSRRGIAVLRSDDRGVGGSQGSVSDSTTLDLARDALAAIDFLARQPGIDPDRLGVIGHSEGAVIAPIVATMSDRVRFIVMMAGTGVTGREVLVAQLEALLRASGAPEHMIDLQREAQRSTLELMTQGAPRERIEEHLRELNRDLLRAQADANPDEPPPDDAAVEAQVQAQLAAADSVWFRAFVTLDPRPYLRRVTVPVLAMNGELDLQVLPDQNLPEIERALKEAGNTDVTIARLPGLNHLFQKAQTGTVDEYATIEETLNPAALDLISTWVRARTGLD